MANRQRTGQRNFWLGRLGLLLLLALMGIAIVPGGLVQAGSTGTSATCFKGMQYSNGAVGCNPRSTGIFPGPGGLAGPSGPIQVTVCVPKGAFLQMNASYGWGVDPLTISGPLWWNLNLLLDGFSDPQLIGYFPNGFSNPCPPPPPPPPPGNPVVFLTYDSILAFAPEAFWSGTADCPAGEPPGDACPPSVGNAIHVWVAGFGSSRGPTQVCSKVLSPFWYFTSYQACLRWRQVGGTTWDFDDETVSGARVKGLNYGVPEAGTGPGSAISHTFEYPSGFDPIRNCVRPCPGDALGPPLPGHPGGAPAFQVTVNAVWEVELRECFSTGGPPACTAWRFIDLRTLGAPTADFTSTSLIPVPVVEYGGSPP